MWPRCQASPTTVVKNVLLTLCAMRLDVLALTLVGAALTGDNCNYWIGRLFGSRIASGRHPRVLNRKALERTQDFYARHGGKTIVLARFVPIVRTFAPFVAGVGHMARARPASRVNRSASLPRI